MGRIIDRKVDHKDLKMVVDEKADRQELMEKFVFRNDYEALRSQTEDLCIVLDLKLDKGSFVSFDQTLEEKLQDIVK
jgi:hypothetical protein